MMKLTWPRLLGLCLVQTLVLVGLGALGLRLTDRFLVVERNGGDRSQTSPVDFASYPAPPPLPVFPEARVENVILLVGDGLGFSQVAVARSELGALDRRLVFERFPFTGWQTTHALDSVYTDSAASATSLATGFKVPTGFVSVTPEGRRLTTLAEAARDRGLSVGVLTDSYLWDATPAAFLSHVSSRRGFLDIASQMAASGVEWLAGTAHPRQVGDAGHDSESLELQLAEFARADFALCRTLEDLERLPADDPRGRLALFAPGAIADRESAPSLADLAEVAIDHLARDPDGYFLVIESEDPDSGGHNRNLRQVVRGIRSLEEVALLAVEEVLESGDTLLLMTGDHETGGLGILHGDAEHSIGVRWTTRLHSGEPVPIYAFGAGAERFTGVKDNTDLARILSDLLDLGMFPET